MTDDLSKAEFRLGEDGEVKEMGVLLEAEMGDAKIWFKKAGAENCDGHENLLKARDPTVKMESAQIATGARWQRKLFSRSGKGLAPLFA